MDFTHILTSDDGRAEEIFSAYEQTFPSDERRNKKQYLALFQHPYAKVFSINDDKENVGYLITWHLDDFYYIEHFEVFEKFRNRKLGSEILKEFSAIHPQLVLESEPATQDEIAKRRIDFYQRNGFKIIDKKYIQPAYEKGKNPLNLWLLSNVKAENTSILTDKIHKIVYNVH